MFLDSDRKCETSDVIYSRHGKGQQTVLRLFASDCCTCLMVVDHRNFSQYALRAGFAVVIDNTTNF